VFRNDTVKLARESLEKMKVSKSQKRDSMARICKVHDQRRTRGQLILVLMNGPRYVPISGELTLSITSYEKSYTQRFTT
jgi:hypothetical protein